MDHDAPLRLRPHRERAATPLLGGVIGGRAFYDGDNDGRRDGSHRADADDGAVGINVWLFSCGDAAKHAPLAVATTSSGGGYRFENLIPGKYFVTAQRPSGYEFSQFSHADDGSVDGNTSIDGARDGAMVDNTIDSEERRTICFQLGEGDEATGWSFGLHRPSEVPTLQPTTPIARYSTDQPLAAFFELSTSLGASSAAPALRPSGSPTVGEPISPNPTPRPTPRRKPAPTPTPPPGPRPAPTSKTIPSWPSPAPTSPMPSPGPSRRQGPDSVAAARPAGSSTASRPTGNSSPRPSVERDPPAAEGAAGIPTPSQSPALPQSTALRTRSPAITLDVGMSASNDGDEANAGDAGGTAATVETICVVGLLSAFMALTLIFVHRMRRGKSQSTACETDISDAESTCTSRSRLSDSAVCSSHVSDAGSTGSRRSRYSDYPPSETASLVWL